MALPVEVFGEVEQLHAFLRERFRSEPEAASFIGGPAGSETILGLDELARALRMAGYQHPAERLLARIGESDRVRVSALLQGSGLPREPPVSTSCQSLRGGPSLSPRPERPATLSATFAVERELRQEIVELRREFSTLRSAVKDRNAEDIGVRKDFNEVRHEIAQLRSWSRERTEADNGPSQFEFQELQREVAQLHTSLRERGIADKADGTLRQDFQELRREVSQLRSSSQDRNMVDVGEEKLRRLASKLEESISKEASALRADCGELRESLSEALRLMGQEQRDRRGDAALAERGLSDLRAFVEERLSKLEAAPRDRELEARLGDERLRAKELSALAERLGRAEDTIRAECAAHNSRAAQAASRTNDLSRQLDELRARQGACRLESRGQSSERESSERSREMVEDLQVRLAKLTQSHEHVSRRLESQIADLRKGVDLESRERAHGLRQTMVAEQMSKEHGAREIGRRESLGVVRERQAEQYNQLVQEVEKLTTMLSEEAKLRHEQNQALLVEIDRLRQEVDEESRGSRAAVRGTQEELQEVARRYEVMRESWLSKETEQWRAIGELHELTTSEVSRLQAVDVDLRQLIRDEVCMREEQSATTMRAMQLVREKTNEDCRAAAHSEAVCRETGEQSFERKVMQTRAVAEDTRVIVDQREEETRQRFKAIADVLALEEDTRRSADEALHKEIRDSFAQVQARVQIDEAFEDNVRRAFGAMDGRMHEVETRQKRAEERTVSMIDAITSGVVGTRR